MGKVEEEEQVLVTSMGGRYTWTVESEEDGDVHDVREPRKKMVNPGQKSIPMKAR